MRINLQCPFQDKDLAKQRGARWDPQLRVWYVQDVADLVPFAKWLPAAASAAGPAQTSAPGTLPARADRRPRTGPSAMKTGPALGPVPTCSCKVLPWDDCECTRCRPLVGT